MESTSGRYLTKDVVDTCLTLLKRIQEHNCISAKEREAAVQLAEWLADFDLSESSDTDEALDECSRALLASYTDTSRKRLASGLGDVIGTSPSLRTSLLAKQPRMVGQEDLETELDKLVDWCAFDVFRVAKLSRGRPLETVAYAVLERFDLIEKLQLDSKKLKSCLREIETAYGSTNPYHNSIHASDVTQSLGCILTHDSFSENLSDMELLSMIFAAAVHDVGHPGLSNEFLVNSGAEAAVEYNDRSVNENMHAATAFRILLKPHNNFLAHLPNSHFSFFRRTVISIVLSTDMAHHTELIGEFATNVRLLGADVSGWRPEQRMRALQLCVHCSDIANPAKPLRFSKQWTERVLCEFFAQYQISPAHKMLAMGFFDQAGMEGLLRMQGDIERERGMPISPQCDREKVEIAKSQLVFLERVVRPCYGVLKVLAPNTASMALQLMDEASLHWERLQNQKHAHSPEHMQCAAQAKQPAESHFPLHSPGVFPLDDV